MKQRPMTFFDGVVLMLLYMSVTNTGPSFPEWVIFLPWLAELLIGAGRFMVRLNGWDKSAMERFARFIVRIRAKRAARAILRSHGKK